MIVAAVFIGLILIGMPIGFVIGAAGVCGLVLLGGTSFLAIFSPDANGVSSSLPGTSFRLLSIFAN